MVGNTAIYDCGCVVARPKDPHCHSYGTRWRVYISISKTFNASRIMLRCRDCGRVRHFVLHGDNPTITQYTRVDSDDDDD